MATVKKKAAKKKVASKPEAAPSLPASQNARVKVRNTTTRSINVLGGIIGPGEEGETTVAQARQFRKFLEVL